MNSSTQQRVLSSKPVAHPEDNDILCGKDKACASHIGSRRFRRIIDSYRQQYQDAITKYDKMAVTKEIYESLRTTSRFLKYNEVSGLWEDITPLAARDKVGHALRFASRAGTGQKKNKKSLASSNCGNGSLEVQSMASLVSQIQSPFVGLHFEPDDEALTDNGCRPTYDDNRIWDSLMDHLQNSLTQLKVEVDASPMSRTIFDEVDSYIMDDSSMSDFLVKLQDKPLFGRRGSIEEALMAMAGTRTDFERAMEMPPHHEDTLATEILSILRDPVGEWNQDSRQYK